MQKSLNNVCVHEITKLEPNESHSLMPHKQQWQAIIYCSIIEEKKEDFA